MKTSTLVKKQYSVVRPFIYKKPSLTSISFKMVILLLLQVILLGVYKSYDALIVIGSASLGSVLVFVFRYFTGKAPVYYVFKSLLQGLLTGMLLPETFPPLVAFFIVFLVVLCMNYLSSETSNNWVNEVAFSVLIAWFIGKSFFPSFFLSSEMMQVKNPSLNLIQSGAISLNSMDSFLTNLLNNSIFRLLKVNVPEGYISYLWDSHSAIPAFRFNLMTLFASIILFADDSVDYKIPAIFLVVYLVLVRLFAPMFFGGSFNSGDILLALFSSGTLFVTLFLLQWSGTVPSTKSGKTFYAIFMGLMAFILVGSGTSPIGMVYLILMGNLFSVVVKVIETRVEIMSVGQAE